MINLETPRNRAGVIIIRDSKILLIHRWNSDRGEYYIIPGGGIEEGESPEDTAIRELKEEAGVTIFNLQLFSRDSEESYVGDQYWFTAEIKEGDGPIWQEEHKQTPQNTYAIAWVEIESLKELHLVPYTLRDRIYEQFSK